MFKERFQVHVKESTKFKDKDRKQKQSLTKDSKSTQRIRKMKGDF